MNRIGVGRLLMDHQDRTMHGHTQYDQNDDDAVRGVDDDQGADGDAGGYLKG